MLSKLRNSKKEQGFTIIEVLIVLAIAGLILLIVFLAVPALQRNSRNTQRKDDIARIGSAVQEYVNNNNGTSTLTDAGIQALLGKLAFYTTTNVTVGTGALSGTPTNATTVDTVNVYSGAACATASGAQGAVSGSTRQVAIVYTTESGSGGTTKLCTES